MAISISERETASRTCPGGRRKGKDAHSDVHFTRYLRHSHLIYRRFDAGFCRIILIAFFNLTLYIKLLCGTVPHKKPNQRLIKKLFV